MKILKTFDIDGVIFLNKNLGVGIMPPPDAFIITGRSFEEKEYTLSMLDDYGIDNIVFFSPEPFESKTREISGHHKADMINKLMQKGHYDFYLHYEDDPVQAKIIRENCPNGHVIMVQHELTEKENVWHG